MLKTTSGINMDSVYLYHRDDTPEIFSNCFYRLKAWEDLQNISKSSPAV